MQRLDDIFASYFRQILSPFCALTGRSNFFFAGIVALIWRAAVVWLFMESVIGYILLPIVAYGAIKDFRDYQRCDEELTINPTIVPQPIAQSAGTWRAIVTLLSCMGICSSVYPYNPSALKLSLAVLFSCIEDYFGSDIHPPSQGWIKRVRNKLKTWLENLQPGSSTAPESG